MGLLGCLWIIVSSFFAVVFLGVIFLAVAFFAVFLLMAIPSELVFPLTIVVIAFAVILMAAFTENTNKARQSKKDFYIQTLDVILKKTGDSLYVQPYAIINSPTVVRITICFELWDTEENCHLRDLIDWTVSVGETTIYSQIWTALPPNTSFEGWELRIYSWSRLLAKRIFRAEEIGGGRFRQYLDGDGELSDELVDLLDDAPVIDEDMTLDELL